MPKPTNIEIGIHNLGEEGYERFAVHFEWRGFRHHWWSFSRALFPDSSKTLYRNPPAGVEHNGPGYFRTRHLNVEHHATMIEALRQEAVKLLPAAIEAEKRRQLDRVAKLHAEWIAEALSDARKLISKLAGYDVTIGDQELSAELCDIARRHAKETANADAS